MSRYLRGSSSWWLRLRNDLHKVIEKALSKKLPKLVRTVAERRILMLERQHMNFVPKQILDEVERQRPLFPGLAQVNELWIVETMDFDEGYLHFEHYQGSECVEMLSFEGPKLFDPRAIDQRQPDQQSPQGARTFKVVRVLRPVGRLADIPELMLSNE